jgi:hypothetical protein
MWWEETSPPSQTLVVWEDPPETLSQVLDKYGQPYTIRKEYKLGFDLSPKEKDNEN